MNTFVILRKVDDFHYNEPIYAGTNQEFALAFSKIGSYVVMEFDSEGRYLNTHRG